jgi:hypothetical protein
LPFGLTIADVEPFTKATLLSKDLADRENERFHTAIDDGSGA